MSHPDPLFDPDNSYEDDEMNPNYDDYNDFNEMVEDGADDFWYDDGDESMDGDHDSAMDSIGWGDDDSLAYGGGDYYGEDF